jgi:rod shape-determining protein MreD
MKHLVLIITTYLALAAHAACGAALSIGECRPPLMWLPIVLALTWFADSRGIVWAALIGLLADGLSDGRFGVEMLAATMTAVLTISLRPADDVRSRWPWFVWWFVVIATGLLLSRGLGCVLSDGPAVTIASLMTLSGDAAYGLTLCGVFGVSGAFRVRDRARFHHA